MSTGYRSEEPSRAEVDAMAGATLLDFGNDWCGYCARAKPLVDSALRAHPGVRHVRVADASGRRLGRSFRVKLWPTLVFLDGGNEVARLVRPGDPAEIEDALRKIDPR
jgi:thioredoxin 1